MFLISVDVSFVFDDFRIVVPIEREFPKISAGNDFVDSGEAEIVAVGVLAERGVVLPAGWVLDTNILGFRGGFAE